MTQHTQKVHHYAVPKCLIKPWKRWRRAHHHIEARRQAICIVYISPCCITPATQGETRMESKGIICTVNEPTPWCAGMVIVPKHSGNVQICVDLKPLNESILRESYFSAEGGRDTSLTGWRQMVQQVRYQQRVMADTSGKAILSFHNIYYSQWPLLLQQISFRHF